LEKYILQRPIIIHSREIEKGKKEIKLVEKWDPGLNFTSICDKAFTSADPKGTKKTDNLTVFFALLGSAQAKDARRTLMKLTP